MMPQHCTVLIPSGEFLIPLPDGSAPPDIQAVALDGLEIGWGRSTSLDQPEGSTCTFDVSLLEDYQDDQVVSTLLTIGATLYVEGSVDEPPEQDAYVFTGTVTDVAITWDTGWARPRASIAAVDASNQARSEIVGAEPFPAESAWDRLTRLSEITATGQWIGATPDTTRLVAAMLASQDVDARPWAELVEEAATSTEHAAWPVWGPPVPDMLPPWAGTWARAGILLTSLNARPATRSLHALPGGAFVTVGPRNTLPDGTAALSSCWAPRAGAAWQRSAGRALTRVAATWLLDTVDPETSEPAQNEQTVTVADAAAEAGLGVHGASVATLLNSQAQAVSLAENVLARNSQADWAFGGVQLDAARAATPADAAAFTATMTMLSREGLAVDLGELPTWGPGRAEHLLGFLEGGTLTFTGGRWIHDVNVSTAAGDDEAATWDDLPAAAPWTWDQVDPSVQWWDTAVPVEITSIRTNVLPNPSFETNTTGWVAVRAAIARTAAPAQAGGYVLRVTNDGTASTHYVGENPRPAAAPGQTTTFSAYARLVTGSGVGYYVRVYYYDAASAVIGASIVGAPGNLPSDGSWIRLHATTTAPAGAVTVNWTVTTPNTRPTDADVWELDAALAEVGDVVGSYIEGTVAI